MNTTTTATPLVEVRGLHTFYGNSHVLHGVDLQIAPGETLALLSSPGPSERCCRAQAPIGARH
jgi:branched-chain amino acid transport system ATP-binding protein